MVDNALVPKTCTWELTLRCNLNCGHCGSRAGKARNGEMDRTTMLRTARELRQLGCERITLSGGEPTLSPWWQDVTAEGARLGLRINMITNGMSFDRERIRQAKSAGLLGLGVSLDGLEGAHDQLRRHPGLFGKVMQLLDDCTAESMPVAAITTISRLNYRDLEGLHDLLAGRVYAWQLQLGAAMGNLADRRCDQIAPEDLLEIVPTVARLIGKGRVKIHVADNLGYYGPYEAVLRSARSSPLPCWAGCHAGCRNIGIEADGGVKGCLSLQADSITEGNLQRENLSEIWNRNGAFAYNRAFSLDDLSGFCRTCTYAAVCRGGCLSMRKCEGGRDNPFCYHRVATIADPKTSRRKRARYIPMTIAPATLLALAGCGPSYSEEEAFYSAPCPPSCGQPPVDSGTDQDANIDVTPHYGLPEAGTDTQSQDAADDVESEGGSDSSADAVIDAADDDGGQE